MALFNGLGKVRIGFLVLLSPFVVLSDSAAESLSIRQKSNLGFVSNEKIELRQGSLFYNQMKVQSPRGALLYRQMKQVKFVLLAESCLAGTVEVIFESPQKSQQMGCLSGDNEKKLITHLQELRFLAVSPESGK